MSTKSLILSSAGLRNLVPNIQNVEDEFLFVFGEKEIRMSKINADFISPLISRIHCTDPTIEMYKYPTDERMKEIFTDEILTKLKKLCLGDTIEVEEAEIKKLKVISILLWNEELQIKLEELFQDNYNEKKMSKIIEELSINEYISKYGKASIIESRSSIHYIASNFYKLDKQEIDDLIKLPLNLLLSIVSSPALKLLNEDSLFEFIDKIFNRSENCFAESQLIDEFYENVEIENLSMSMFCEFIEIVNESNMTRAIWLKLKQLLTSHYKEKSMYKQNSPRYINQQQIEYNGTEEGAFKGIIAYLTENCRGNVNEKNEVKVTGSSQPYSNRSAKYAVDLDDKEHYFQSDKSNENSWLKYDFKDKKVRPTHYSIRTRHDYGKGYQHPQYWVIEGSNTDRDDDWKVLDTRNDITVLNGENLLHTFDIQEKLGDEEFYRYLRIRQTGKNIYGSYCLTLSALEYFGIIKIE